ncbi:MAG: hypothetical protein GC153_07990 [Alphaproteobacteria bacterium]|nr:hypothetical protein [Alphaproteobacteria bacterium]
MVFASSSPAGKTALAQRQARLVVIGNGPSLRGFDFSTLEGADTIGMNAAYRHWDRIGWRPTHYACLDDALIDTHHNEIRRLMNEGRIETAFVSGRYLDHHPEAAKDPRFVFLDEFVAHWHGARGAAHGLSFRETPFFRSADESKLTTGAYALRYGAWLGYREIALIGVDLVYRDLTEASALEGNRLRLDAAPASNPNYFFDDYQRPGDEFHVPNPAEHDGELHVQAFGVLRDDFLREKIETHIFNANPNSVLATQGIFPFRPLETFLGGPALSSVVVPVTAGERGQILDNIWLWSQPAFFPFLGAPPARRPVLVFVFNNDAAAAMRGEIEAALKASAFFARCFAGARYVNLGLKGEADLYERDNAKPAGAQGRRAGPNNMFFGGLDAVKDLPGYALWLETDCTPIRPDWLGRAAALVRTDDAPWIIGSIYRGRDALGPREMRHINGNALYAAGAPAFREFLTATWKPQLDRLVRESPELAFDCVIDSLFEAADSRQPDNPNWRLMQEISARLRYTDFIQNIVDESSSPAEKAEQLAGILRDCPDACLVHSRLVARQIARLRETGAAAGPGDLVALLGGGAPARRAPAPKSPLSAPAPSTLPPRSLAGFLRWSAGALKRRRRKLAAALLAALALIAAAGAFDATAGLVAASAAAAASALAVGALARRYLALARRAR